MGNLSNALRALCALGMAALPTAGLQAAEAITGTLSGCRTLHDDAARLACYDRLPDPAAAPAAAGSAQRAAPAAAAVPTTAAAPSAAPAPLSAEQRFGINELQQARAEATQAPPRAELKELRASVTLVQHQARGGLRLALANGQVWYQVSPSEQIEVAAGDEVVIRPASLGSFLLVDAHRHSARVHRAQ
jgi:hypothetical protein